MDEANILIIENDLDYQGVYTSIVTKGGHKVVASVATEEVALVVLSQIDAGEAKVDIVLLDNNLATETSKEGSYLAPLFAERGVFTIGMSRFDMENVTVNCGKSNVDDKLLKIIEAL